ncbi:MAG: hypothetical protein KGJ59_10930 [Bacteroidota bacterium]|nr:hypothetical protein [Bacteroidota bacterium]
MNSPEHDSKSPSDNNRKNDLLRAYVIQRDRSKCQWPGCGSGEELEVLFIMEDDGTDEQPPMYQNGVTLCTKHKEVVMLQERMFAPLVFDLIQLVEFEHDLVLTEKTYKEILGEGNSKSFLDRKSPDDLPGVSE